MAWILGIDFGTTYTTAAAAVDGRAEIIEIDGDRRVPSVILVGQSDALVVGKAAENQAPLYPDRMVREPKRLLGEPAPVIVGGKPYPVTRLVGAILEHVYQRTVEHQGEPPAEVRLTHPASWRRPRIKALGEAAALAGIAAQRFIQEPVAAAIAYATDGGEIGENRHVAIYDLGGGTFDTAVLRSAGDDFVVVGRPGGDARLGGEFFDELLANHLGMRLPPASWDALQVSDELVWRQAHAAFRTEVRRAKEALSLQPLAELLVALPAGLERLAVSREEFETLIRPYVDETADMLSTTIAEAGVAMDQLAAIYLVGGASRTPLVERVLQQTFPAIPISRRGDPKMVVALGATHAKSGAVATAAGAPPAESSAVVGAAPLAAAANAAGVAGAVPAGQAQADSHSQAPPTPAAVRRRWRTRTGLAAATVILGGIVAAASVAAAMWLGVGQPSPEVAEASRTPAPTRTPRVSPSPSESASEEPSATPDETPAVAAEPSIDSGGNVGSSGGGGGGGGDPGGGGGPAPPLQPPAATPTPVPAPVVTPTPAPVVSDCTVTPDGNGFLIGTAGPDVMCGNDANNAFWPGGGNDVIRGFGGYDTLYFQSPATGCAASGVTVNVGSASVAGGCGTDSFSSIEEIWGTPYGDTFYGAGGTDRFYGSGSNDSMYGGGGDDRLHGDDGNDHLDGQDGADHLDGGPGTDSCVAGEDLIRCE